MAFDDDGVPEVDEIREAVKTVTDALDLAYRALAREWGLNDEPFSFLEMERLYEYVVEHDARSRLSD